MVGPNRRRQRLVEDAQETMVLPEADAEGDRDRDRAYDQSGAQLVEVIDDAEAILVIDGPEDPRHHKRALAGLCAGFSRAG